jgi:hypothetical protein
MTHEDAHAPSTPESAAARVDRLRKLLVLGDLTAGGLLPGSRRADLEAALGVTGRDGFSFGILSGRSLPWTLYDNGTDKETLRAIWEPTPSDRIVELDVVHPRSTLTAEALRSRLGPPEAELPARTLSHRAQLVYARLGITLGVGLFGKPPALDEPLGAVWLYVPTSTDDYRTQLGGDDRPKPPNPLPY